MNFSFDEKSYTAEQVLEVLNPQLTDSRKEKIQFVDFRRCNMILSKQLSNSAHKIQDIASYWLQTAP